jgi:hypothetical protein
VQFVPFGYRCYSAKAEEKKEGLGHHECCRVVGPNLRKGFAAIGNKEEMAGFVYIRHFGMSSGTKCPVTLGAADTRIL